MSAHARLVSWWTRCVVSDDPNPCHTRPEASTYPTRTEVRAAVDDALYHPGTGTSLVVPHIRDRVTRNVIALWDPAERPNYGTDWAELDEYATPGEYGDVDVFPHTNGGTR